MTYYNPKIHHRRSIRLKNYDYSQAGLYFITICCQDRVCRFGDVIDGKMILNDAGRMIEKWYYELENKYNDIRCHEMVVMPNHFHCIVENVGFVVVGADLRVCPYNNKSERGGRVVDERGALIGDENGTLNGRGALNENGTRIGGERGGDILGEHKGSPLHRVMQWFKTMTTNEYIRGVKTLGWQPFDGKIWQRNYYEHIIRNEQSFQRISEYIINNPRKWNDDKFHKN